MKSKIHRWKYNVLTLLIVSSLSLSAQPKDETSQLSISKEVKFTKNPKVKINVYDLNLDLYPTKSEFIRAEVLYYAESDKKVDLDKLHQALEQGLLLKKDEEITIDLKFYKQMISKGTSGNNKTTITLKDDSKIKLQDFDLIGLKVYLPSTLQLTMDAKYSNISMHMSLIGDQIIKAYDSEIEAKNIDGDVDLKLDYSKLEMSRFNNGVLNLYESNIKLKQTSNLQLNSKYGNHSIGKADKLDYNGYEDKLNILQLNTLKGEAKYTNIELGLCKSIDIVTYEGSIEANQLNIAKIEAKYTEFEFKKVDSIYANKNYECDYEITQVDAFVSNDGKYNEFEIDLLTKKFTDSGYETELEIERIDPNFEFIDLKGKYLDAELQIPKTVSYYFKGDISYANFDLDQSSFKRIIDVKEGSKRNFKYLHGNKEDTPKTILVNGYEVHISINQ